MEPADSDPPSASVAAALARTFADAELVNTAVGVLMQTQRLPVQDARLLLNAVATRRRITLVEAARLVLDAL